LQVKRDLEVLCKVYQVDSPSVRDSGVEVQSNIESPPQRTEFEVWSDSSPSPREENGGGGLVMEREIQVGDGETELRVSIEEETGDLEEREAEEGRRELQGEEEEEAQEGRKTPRRVHFGGEVVKLRTPDSDPSQEAQENTPNNTFQVGQICTLL
jgi:hypothetical protein